MSDGPASAGDPAGRAFANPRAAWWMLGVLTLLYALSLLDRQIIALLVTDLRRDLKIDDFQIGLITGLAFALFYVTFGLLFGRAADSWSRRGTIFVGVLLWSGAAAGCGLARNVWHLALARFGLGAGEAALNPSAYSLISDSFPRHRLSLALSVFGVGSTLGSSLSIALGGLLVAALPAAGVTLPGLGHMASWRVAFLVIGLPGFLIAFLVWTFREPLRRQRRSEAKTSFRAAFAFMRGQPRFFLGHFLGFGLMIAIINGWQAWTPTYLIRHFHLSIGEFVPILALMNLVIVGGGTIAAGALTDRLTARGRTTPHLVLPIIMGLVEVVAVILAIMAPTPSLFFAMTAVVLMGPLFNGVAVAALQLVTPNEYRGQVSACYLFFFNLIGIGVGPTLVGWLTSRVFADDAMVGWSIALTAVILGPLAIAALALARSGMRDALGQVSDWAKS